MKPETAYKLFNAYTCPYWILGMLAILFLSGCAGYTTRVGGAYEQQDGTRYEAYTEIYRADSKLIKPLK